MCSRHVFASAAKQLFNYILAKVYLNCHSFHEKTYHHSILHRIIPMKKRYGGCQVLFFHSSNSMRAGNIVLGDKMDNK